MRDSPREALSRQDRLVVPRRVAVRQARVRRCPHETLNKRRPTRKVDGSLTLPRLLQLISLLPGLLVYKPRDRSNATVLATSARWS